MRLRVALALVTVALLVMACSVTRGSGQLATESGPVSGFTNVELSGTGELTLTSEVSGDTLTLGAKPNTSIVPTKPITYSLTVKDLTGLAMSGSGSVRVCDLTTTSLSTKVSGSGTITVNGRVDDRSGLLRLRPVPSRAIDKQDCEGSHLT